jgi:S-adenosylmethionine:tRNA-ribosyltransferase-isomerase (queuine synthetase)
MPINPSATIAEMKGIRKRIVQSRRKARLLVMETKDHLADPVVTDLVDLEEMDLVDLEETDLVEVNLGATEEMETNKIG